MAGDASNASVWPDADVYWTSNLDATNPATVDDPFGVDWDLVGLLDGDDGFADTRDEDVADHYAWGGVLVRTTRAHFKATRKFSLLEDNTVTRSLIWPGSTDTSLVVPRPAKVKVAFETRELSTGKIRRLISKNYAEVSVDGDITENETDVTKFQMQAVIYPDASVTPPQLWIRQASDLYSG